MNTAREDHPAPGRSRAGQESEFGSRRWLPRWLALMGATSAILLAVGLVTPGTAVGAANPVPVVITIAICVLFCFVPAVRGSRLRDAEVLLIALFTDGVIAYVGLLVAESPPEGDAVMLLLTWPTLITAAYLPRRLVMAQVIAGSVAGAVILQRLFATPGVGALQVCLLALSLAVIALVVTQLREGLVDALDRATHAASIDVLTGLDNRHGIAERVPELWASTARRGESLEVLLVDIDHFKTVNDRHDHALGDQVLAQVADIVRSTVRADDLVGRFGGDEFIVLAAVPPGADPGQVGDRIRRAVQEQSGPVSVTVSVGSTTIVPRHGADILTTLADQVHVADRAMYASKQAGRNRVTRS